MALGQSFMCIALGLPRATIPDEHGAPAILALRDIAFEVAVIERMVLGLHRKPLFARHEARAPRDRPALQHAVEFEPEIVVQTRRCVLLHDERKPAALGFAAARLRRDAEVALLVIGLEIGGRRA